MLLVMSVPHRILLLRSDAHVASAVLQDTRNGLVARNVTNVGCCFSCSSQAFSLFFCKMVPLCLINMNPFSVLLIHNTTDYTGVHLLLPALQEVNRK